MAVVPDEQESQVVAPLHSPEQAYLDDAFPGGADGYHNADGDEDEYGPEIAMDELLMDTQSRPSQNLQPNSNQSFVEETQLAYIEMDTQSIQHREQSVQNDTQNSSFGSRSVVGETQLEGIEVDGQATEDATQFANPDSSSQKQVIRGNDQSFRNVIHHDNMSPPKIFSKPDIPESNDFKYAPAKHVKRNREPPVHSTPVVKVASQTEKIITGSLPESATMPDSHDKPSTNPVQHTQKALHLNHSASMPPLPDDRASPTVKPSVLEKNVVPPLQNTTAVKQLPEARNLPSINSVSPREENLYPHNTPADHPMSDDHVGTFIKSSIQSSFPERAKVSNVRNTLVIEPPSVENLTSTSSAPPSRKLHPVSSIPGYHQISDIRSVSSVKTLAPESETHPIIRNTTQAEQVLDAHPRSSVEVPVTKTEARSITQNTSMANSLIQTQPQRLINPLPRTEEMSSTSHGICSHSASAIGPLKNANTFKIPNPLPVSRTSHSEQSKPAEAPPPRQDTLAPTHGPQRSRLRQGSSNRLKRFSAKTKFNVQGALIKKAPFPEAFSDQRSVQVCQDRPRKTQPPPQLDTHAQYSGSPLAEKDLPTRVHTAAESLECGRSPTNDYPAQDYQPQGNAVYSINTPAIIPHSKIKDSNVETEDSIMTSVEFEENLPTEDSRQPRQPIPVSQFQQDHQMVNSNQYPSVYREPSRSVTQSNTSRTQSRVNTPRRQQAAQTQSAHQTRQRAMKRPMQPHDLEPQGVYEAVSSRRGQTKVAKTTSVCSQGDNGQIPQIGDHISKQQKEYFIDQNAIQNFIAEVQRQESIIREQRNHIANLNAQLQDACEINTELEARKDEFSKRVERLNDLSNEYKKHINEVVICQKFLRQDSKDIKRSVQDIKDTEVQTNRMRKILEEIKQAQREQCERDSNFENLMGQIHQLQDANEKYKAEFDTKSAELQQERNNVEQLQKHISNGELDRHKEVMEILQKPQVDTLGELTKEDGILHKVLKSSEEVQGKLDNISKTVKNAVSKTSEWPQTLTKSLDEVYSRIQTKLDENGSKDASFQESTVKLFDDLKEGLNKVKGDLDEKNKLSEQLNHLRENNATLKANLSSKEAELENNMSRLNELALKLEDVRFQLKDREEQLAISKSQPREDPAIKRKVDDLIMETSRLQNLLATANNTNLQAENTVQTHQARITTLQNQLSETEEKLRTVESNVKKLEGLHQQLSIESKSATDRARQETTQLALSQRKELEVRHDTTVNELKQKQAETEKKLKAAVDKSEASQKAFDDQAIKLGQVESELATYKDQLLQQKLQLQTLEENSISAPQLLMQKQEHKQEILSIRQEQANQLASSQACRDESLKIKNELEGAQKRVHGMNEENENLKKENDRLRQRLESITMMAESSQMIVSNVTRAHDARPPLRRPAERRSSNFHSQHNDGDMGVNQLKAPESNTSAVLTSPSLGTHGGNNGGSLTPIKPFSTIASVDTSPLTDLEDIMPKVQYAYSREDLQRVYNKNRQVSNGKTAHMEDVSSKYYSHGEENLGNTNSRRNAVILPAEEGLISTPNQVPRSVPSIAQESIQRRTRKPLKSAMKKGDHQDSPITLKSSQDQVHGQMNESETAGFKKPVLRNTSGLNNGLQSISRTGASGYNRIAIGQSNIPGPRAPEQSKPAPLYEPTPEIKRNAMKRARSNLSFGAVDLQPTKPAKAPKLNLRRATNKTVIPDSQDRS
ncbi:hypothetical protein DSL72_007284 [Monilinia vaccinii-corymbosi]|uniref:Uncharacterized protein n=1 Tax=Monilinia vaccinii-corymbosi TaxID=61207 RepID=A0A8A3PMJ0_9HELO|nr:hypothetical protein DSL72_007284 [Monilinia vaccinii-corymbosi]